mgnify:CR=1 FL=1
MPKSLTPQQIADYETQGFTSPVPVLSAEEVREARSAIEAFERRTGRTLDYPEKSKSYLLFDWADKLVRHPAILDAVEDLIGPHILVYHSTMWIKDPGTAQYIAWHQDGTYFYLDPQEHVTAWVALSDASVEAGCMHVLPGTRARCRRDAGLGNAGARRGPPRPFHGGAADRSGVKRRGLRQP